MRRWYLLLLSLTFIAGCGGGGGSAGTPGTVPTIVPSSGPTAHPSASPTTNPSGSPSAHPSGIPSVSPSAKPSSSPSAKPSSSPTAQPTITPSPTPAPTATPFNSVPSWNGQTINTDISPSPTVNGSLNPFTPQYGDTSTGGQGAAFDSDLQCANEMSNNYHIHVFIGIYYNGQEVMIPEGIGVIEPAEPGQQPPAEIVSATNCFYYTHTHDSTGIVHVEDPNPDGTLITQPIHTLADVFTVWGITVNSSQFGPMTGPIAIFTSGQVYRGGASCSGNMPPAGTQIGNGTTPESDLTLWTGSAGSIPLYSHEVIWFYIGSGNPTSLPNVSFYEEC